MEKFDQFSNQKGFIDIGDKEVQINIGEIKDVGDYIEVETKGGCSKDVLLNAMHEIANESKKTVKALFNDELIVIDPEESEK